MMKNIQDNSVKTNRGKRSWLANVISLLCSSGPSLDKGRYYFLAMWFEIDVSNAIPEGVVCRHYGPHDFSVC